MIPGTFAFLSSSCPLVPAAGVPAAVLVVLLNVCASLLVEVCTDPQEASMSALDQETVWTEECSFPT